LLFFNADPDFLKTYLVFTKRINDYQPRETLCIIIQFVCEKWIFFSTVLHPPTISNSESVSLFLESYSHFLPNLIAIQKVGERLKKKSISLLKPLINPFDSNALFLLHTCYVILYAIYSYRWFLIR